MAKLDYSGFGDLEAMFQALGDGITAVCKMGVYDGAAVIFKAIKDATPKDSGDLRDSLGIAKMSTNEDGAETSIGYDGYDRNGTPNVLKARAINSGTSRTRKNPYIRKAVDACKQQAQNAIASTIEAEIQKRIK